MNKIIKITYAFLAAMVVSSCTGDLNTIPIDPDEQTVISLFQDENAYRQFVAKLYAGLSTTGQQGPAGAGDVAGIDEGFSSYLRQYFYHQELTTDEAVIGWNDQTIKDFHDQDWGAGDIFIRGMYSRLFYQITLANEFVRQSTDGLIDSRVSSEAKRQEVREYRAEARFLRALSYYHAMDLFGSVPFVTEDDAIGAFLPEQISRTDLFSYIESELLDIEDQMVAPRENEYGRADRAAVWMLLAKLYLNAEVYTGTSRNTDVLTYVNKVIGAGYTLESDYSNLFKADNDQASGIIFAAVHDGLTTQSYGGTTFIVHAAVGGNMTAANYGIDGGWSGLRATQQFVDKFSDPSGDTDSRAMFYTDGQSKAVEEIPTFTSGYAITKWTNLTSTGDRGSNAEFVDTDFPMFRLADAYLMYAEAVLRGGTGGTVSAAVGYINDLRERAYGDNSGNIAEGDLNLDFILDERARELYWECTRRTDLIRFGQFTNGSYTWDFKGGVKEGRSANTIYNIFPLPSADVSANPNLTQNTGY